MWMNDKKLTNSVQIKLRRVQQLREFALAVSYPLSHSGTAAHRKQTEDEHPAIPVRTLRSRPRDNPEPPESVAKPWKKPWDK
jgi:hypothetical protein